MSRWLPYSSCASSIAATRETRIRRARPSRPPDGPGAAAAPGEPALAQRRGRDHADLHLAVVLDAEQGAEQGHAADEVVGAVDRVDVPASRRGARRRRRTPRRPGRGRDSAPGCRSRITRSIAWSATVTNDAVGLALDVEVAAEVAQAISSAASHAARAKSSHSRSSASGRSAAGGPGGPKPARAASMARSCPDPRAVRIEQRLPRDLEADPRRRTPRPRRASRSPPVGRQVGVGDAALDANP